MGAFSQVWKSVTGTPEVDLKDHRYHLVSYSPAGDLKVKPTAAGKSAVGVAYEPNQVGQPTQIVASGFAYVYLGATVVAGDDAASDADGKAVKAAEGDSVVGTIVVGGSAGAIGTILLK
jgi:hypothetical protein